MKRILCLVGCVIALTVARGDLIPSFNGTSPGSGTNTAVNYAINITSDQEVHIGDFFTIYDFGPFIAGTNVQPAGWAFSSALVTSSPSGVNPPDDPSLANLTWTYTGPSVIPTGTHLGPFSVQIATAQFQETLQLRLSYFAAQGTKVSDPIGTKLSNVGRVSVPVPVPEPTTLSLLAVGALGAAVRAIRRRS
ncbi:MAG TPA: PEP-CTERM sorting domain-containing protein [Chthoniobacterales bacterium]